MLSNAIFLVNVRNRLLICKLGVRSSVGSLCCNRHHICVHVLAVVYTLVFSHTCSSWPWYGPWEKNKLHE